MPLMSEPAASGQVQAAGPPAKNPGPVLEVVGELPREPAAPGGSPLRSVPAWTSLGLAIAFAGLLVPWGALGGNLLQGALTAWVAWYLLMHGLAAVRPAWAPPHRALPVLLVALSALRVGLGGSSALVSFFGWGGASPGAGAFATLLGGLLCLGAPVLGREKDRKLPPPPPPAPQDLQFSQSLLAYLIVFVGLLLPWGSAGERGADSGLGLVTLACVLLALWASWIGVWKLWPTPVISAGRMGFIFFLAPLEAVLMGLFGLVRHLRHSGAPMEAWPGDPAAEHFLVHGAGALLCLAGGGYAVYLLYHGTMAAMAMNKERKAQELAARKAARAARASAGGGGAGEKPPAS